MSSLPAAAEPREARYGFFSGDYVIEMRVSFHDPYLSRWLVVYNSLTPEHEICLSNNGYSDECVERFVGTLATVRYSIHLPGGKTPKNETIREHTTTIAQSSGLPERPPFSKEVRVMEGSASDIQVFGYDETPIPEAERASAREESRNLWMLFRQELYIGEATQPFATIIWKHTLDGISIVEVHSGGPGSRANRQARSRSSR